LIYEADVVVSGSAFGYNYLDFSVNTASQATSWILVSPPSPSDLTTIGVPSEYSYPPTYVPVLQNLFATADSYGISISSGKVIISGNLFGYSSTGDMLQSSEIRGGASILVQGGTNLQIGSNGDTLGDEFEGNWFGCAMGGHIMSQTPADYSIIRSNRFGSAVAKISTLYGPFSPYTFCNPGSNIPYIDAKGSVDIGKEQTNNLCCSTSFFQPFKKKKKKIQEQTLQLGYHSLPTQTTSSEAMALTSSLSYIPPTST